MRTRSVMVLLALLMALTVGALHGWARLTMTRLPRPAPPLRAAMRGDAAADDLLSMLPSATVETQTTIDLFGNEVDHALATYRIDRAGGTYEVHSPETAVSHLRPPKS